MLGSRRRRWRTKTNTSTDKELRSAHFAGQAKAGALATVTSAGKRWHEETLGGAAPPGKYRTLESDFWDGFDGGAVVPLGSQQPPPAMCQAQPKLSIVFVMRVRREFSALLDLVLEEIGCFDHAITTTKAPLTGASTDKKRNNSVFVPRDQRKRGHPIEQPRRIRIRWG